MAETRNDKIRKKKKQRGRRRGGGFIDALNGLLTLVLLAFVLVTAVFIYGVVAFNAEGPIEEDGTFLVEQGNTLQTVANRLHEQGLISNALIFRFGAVALRRDTGVRAGEFEIAAGSSMADILRELTEGTPVPMQVIVPEGFTSWQVVQRVNANEHLTGEIEVMPPEGSLLPGAYAYQRGEARQAVLERMTEAMDRAVAEVWDGRDPELPLSSSDELVVLASIIERETGIADERDVVAGVFVNRLNIGMRLQSDPTIIYGITLGEGSLGRGLRRSEIDEVTPYNTYQIDGLPPGPIANPGIESLRAAANPAPTTALYFVADGSGGHAFADTYNEHQQNVAVWRRIERERAQAAQEAADAEAQAAMDAIAEAEAEDAGVAGQDDDGEAADDE